jgi:hypothetical protein
VKAGDKIKFPFAKKAMEGTVDKVTQKTVSIKADFPHHKGKTIKRKIRDVKE